MATPYELRFDMYNTALDRLKEQYYSKIESNVRAHENGGEKAKENFEVDFPTAKDAIREANVIMDFVNGDQ